MDIAFRESIVKVLKYASPSFTLGGSNHPAFFVSPPSNWPPPPHVATPTRGGCLLLSLQSLTEVKLGLGKRGFEYSGIMAVREM